MNINKNVAFYQQEFFKKEFIGPTMKSAYLDAVKWIATNVISNEEFSDVSFMFEKSKKLPSVTVHLFAVINESDIEINHCRICKESHSSFLESHSSFFMNDIVDCSSCKTKVYQKRLNDSLNHKKLFYKCLLKKTIAQNAAKRGKQKND